MEERAGNEQCSAWVACTIVGGTPDKISPHTLQNWSKQDRIDQGEAPPEAPREALCRLVRRRDQIARLTPPPTCSEFTASEILPP